MMYYEDDYKKYLKEYGVGSKDKVADSIVSYVSYLNSIAKKLEVIISPETLAVKSDINEILKQLSKLKSSTPDTTISKYKTAMNRYIEMVSKLNLNRWNARGWEESVITIEPSGKAPKKYGEGVYRFSANLTLSFLMPRRGWELIKNTKNYVYLKPPPGVPGPPFDISVKIPNKVQAIYMAKEFHKDGEAWRGYIGEWPVWYIHEHTSQMMKITPARGDNEEKRELLPPTKPESSLHIGEYGVWEIALKTTTGEFDYHEHGHKKEGNTEENLESDLYEGNKADVMQTKYERNPQARIKCIEHYGVICTVCSFNFSEIYGQVGTGFIHVHHLKELASIGHEYVIDPIKDLRPVCPNCHAMLHKSNPAYSIKELKNIISQNTYIAKEYFIFFSKFEYALKEAKYFKNQTRAEPDWRAYIQSLNGLDINSLKLISDEAKYLIEEPPEKQVIKDNNLNWDSTTVDDLSEAIYACTRVRNNLFHGGKCSDTDLKRNKNLLQGSMDILKETLEKNYDVKIIFNNVYI